jgi:hypothetical protein
MPSPRRIAIPAFRPDASCALPTLALIALLASGCGDTQVAGTSSGVDNPALTVGFTDATGASLRVTGDLNVYAADQNPAVDPQPLWTIQVKNSAITNLSADDFTRIQGASKSAASALSKTGAKSEAQSRGTLSGAMADSGTAFNLILKTQDKTGNLVLGLKYDSATKIFSRIGGEKLSRLMLQPKPLVRYAAKVSREPVHGVAGRLFVPGTPYLAAVVDSGFVIEDMPQGVFPLRLLTADGKVYPCGDSLNTGDSTRVYRPSTIPVGVVDTSRSKDSIPAFTVFAASDHEAFLEVASFLEAKLAGIDAADPRLSLLWRQLRGPGDSGLADTSFHDSLQKPPPGGLHPPLIVSPTQIRSEVKFIDEGVYHFEIAATVALRTRSDTVTISVRHLPPPPKPRIIQPHPGDSLVEGRDYSISWEMPLKGAVTIQVSINNGEKWVTLAEHYLGKDGVPILPWTPSRELGASSRCLIQVLSEADTTSHARMEGPFYLIQ